MIKNLDLTAYRGNGSTLFTGRPQGIDAREKLKLDVLDKESDIIVNFIIPDGTTSFNPSFYLGLLYDSYKKLGVDGFLKKYHFQIVSTDPEIINVIQKNLNDGSRNAENELNKKTGLRSFIHKAQ